MSHRYKEDSASARYAPFSTSIGQGIRIMDAMYEPCVCFLTWEGTSLRRATATGVYFNARIVLNPSACQAFRSKTLSITTLTSTSSTLKHDDLHMIAHF